jgi:hypothetical protein
MTKRLIATLLVLLAVLTLPYWIYLPLLLAAIIVFPLFWEAIILGFVIDALYGERLYDLPAFLSLYALLSLAAVMLMIPLRHRLRIHV